MTNEVYYAIKVMVWDGEKNKEMYLDLETGSLLDNWMGACTQESTPEELSFRITAFSLHWENKLIQEWKNLFPDLDFHDWGVVKISTNVQLL